eukprot:6230124-Pyramimonas_sp.AAC.1
MSVRSPAGGRIHHCDGAVQAGEGRLPSGAARGHFVPVHRGGSHRRGECARRVSRPTVQVVRSNDHKDLGRCCTKRERLGRLVHLPGID